MIEIPPECLFATAALHIGSPAKNASEKGAVSHVDFRATSRVDLCGQAKEYDASPVVKACERERFAASFVA